MLAQRKRPRPRDADDELYDTADEAPDSVINLPPNVLCSIFSYVEGQQLFGIFTLVCKQWYDLIWESSDLFPAFMRQQFGKEAWNMFASNNAAVAKLKSCVKENVLFRRDGWKPDRKWPRDVVEFRSSPLFPIDNAFSLRAALHTHQDQSWRDASSTSFTDGRTCWKVVNLRKLLSFTEIFDVLKMPILIVDEEVRTKTTWDMPPCFCIFDSDLSGVLGKQMIFQELIFNDHTESCHYLAYYEEQRFSIKFFLPSAAGKIRNSQYICWKTAPHSFRSRFLSPSLSC